MFTYYVDLRLRIYKTYRIFLKKDEPLTNMDNQYPPLTIYLKNKTILGAQLQALNKTRSTIGWLRLAVIIILITTIYVTYSGTNWLVLGAEALAAIVCFLILVNKDANYKEAQLNTKRLLAINEDEINVLNYNFYNRETGQEFEPAQHTYAQDLDIFGKASIYQYLNRCTAQQSKELLATMLLKPLKKADIEARQQAVKELQTKTKWRQQMQSHGMAQPLTLQTQERINTWMQNATPYTSKHWRLIMHLFPIISLGALLLYLYDVINAGIFYLLVFVFFLFAFGLSKKINGTYLLLSRVVSEINTLYQQLYHIESVSFTSTFLTQLQHTLRSNNQQSAGAEITRLKAVLNRFDMRLNILAFYFLNTFLLWDLRQMVALNDWKTKNTGNIDNWFTAIAETEVLLSLATLAYNRPEFCTPIIAPGFFTFKGSAIGHPLINAKARVDNNFATSGTGKTAIITGSNMGGKSTFLRSVGANIVLAQMGSNVCAETFEISEVELMSSMRVTDNLAESTSTFYAELKKLKTIIEAVNSYERVFILLDEILRGTNSLDRHTGSKALLKQFVQKNAVAIIATHDVELAKLQTEYPESITNYHFDVQVSGTQLYFDYKLKDGICKSMNASILMKNIGIEME